MTSARYSRRVALALLVGVAGAIIGALSAYDGDAALKIIMALIGFSFGTAIGVFMIALGTIFLRRSIRLEGNTGSPTGGSAFDPLPLSKNVFDDSYAGNPDRISRQVTGWKLPSDRL